MRKVLALVLAAALALALTACGRDYSADFTGMLDVYSLDMTEDDAIALEDGVDYEAEDLGDSRLLEFENGHIYRFSKKDGSFEFVKWTLPDHLVDAGLEMWEEVIDEGIESWTDRYGGPEFNEKIDSYSWYGKVDGQRAQLSVQKGIKNLTPSMLELDKVK
ncbi:hypothetical protein D1159_11820 [Pseudoflavonifractor sp. 524-17]|uniref:hypothetical protein n=1 Tax=Pseudoflavonifractor sp. 524-17 TaxID=2304577 RepID=UPI00137973F0|nr:hypothetical protein [Pseudoflavonifractor sp. 524-17]NCE65244.1 hypothetical protein [Pseudoflavonifractor sp. 524-17]